MLHHTSPDAPHTAQDFVTLTDDELAQVDGGFLQLLQAAMGIAGPLFNQFGGDKAKRGFASASGILGSLGGLFGGAGGGQQQQTQGDPDQGQSQGQRQGGDQSSQSGASRGGGLGGLGGLLGMLGGGMGM
ncbi:hypothetical protein BH11MYX2_BH11MYX2_04310 [soil metagenome]